MLSEITKVFIILVVIRDVAQLGSALPWGGRGREFKSHRSDQINKNRLV